MIWPVILSGGSGTRLWPLSRLQRPKQLLALAGEATMLQATARRTSDRGRFHTPVVVANEAHSEAIRHQLTAIGTDPSALLLEPVGRNTAPAIALAAQHIAASDPHGTMLVMPSDHVIADNAALLKAIDALEPFVRDGWLATFGIRATAPETGYGYIRLGDRLGDEVFAVRQFVEKPNSATAERYVAGGDYAWNGGIFLMRVDRYLDALEVNAPAIRSSVAEALRAGQSDGLVVRPDAAAFAACPSDSIDYAVMERDDRVAVAPVDMGWSDIGSWDALWDVSPQDGAGNAAQGDTLLIDARNCLVRADGPLVAVVGGENLTVIADRDAVLVAPRGRGQDVKKIVDRLAAEKRSEHIAPLLMARAWGSEQMLTRAPGIDLRLVTVAAGHTTDVRPGGRRVTLLSGSAAVMTEGDARPLPMGEQMNADTDYRIANDGDEPAMLLELVPVP